MFKNFVLFPDIVSSLFKPQLQPTNQIVKMGIDEKDIGDIPIVAKRQASTGNGKVLAVTQNSIEGNKVKKEGKVMVLCSRKITQFELQHIIITNFLLNYHNLQGHWQCRLL